MQENPKGINNIKLIFFLYIFKVVFYLKEWTICKELFKKIKPSTTKCLDIKKI
jgi:hypothetical protein